MSLAHVCVQLVSAEEALAAELAERMHAALGLFLDATATPATAAEGQRGKMRSKLGWCIERVLVREHFLRPDAEITGYLSQRLLK
jgi:hypothetical protein